MNVTAIVLAAGLSRRMGTEKLLLPVDGVPMVQRTLDLLESLPFAKRVLVTVPSIAKVVRTDAEIIYNPTQELGQSLSVRLGVLAAEASSSLLFFMGDQPFLDVSVVEAILAAHDGENIVYPADLNGQPGSPVLFAPRFREDLLVFQGDEGGRQVRRRYPEACCEVQIADSRALLDVDTPMDYEKIKGMEELR